MQSIRSESLIRRRQLEDILVACGQEREWLGYKEAVNSGKVRALIGEAREAGITVRDIARMTGISTQTLHTWMKRHMRPVLAVHYGLHDPPPIDLEESVLRTVGEEPERDWHSTDVRKRIPVGWPTGSPDEVADALEHLARAHLIWDGDQDTYRLAPPASDIA